MPLIPSAQHESTRPRHVPSDRRSEHARGIFGSSGVGRQALPSDPQAPSDGNGPSQETVGKLIWAALIRLVRLADSSSSPYSGSSMGSRGSLVGAPEYLIAFSRISADANMIHGPRTVLPYVQGMRDHSTPCKTALRRVHISRQNRRDQKAYGKFHSAWPMMAQGAMYIKRPSQFSPPAIHVRGRNPRRWQPWTVSF